MARLITILSLLFTSSIVNAVLHPDLSSLLIDDDDDDTPLPLVIWHGLGDNYAADGLAEVGQIAEETNPGTFVYNVRIDEDPSADRSATFFGNLTLQIEKVCADLAKHPILSTAPAIDALGFSQGGQFLRAYVERCNSPPVRSLVTFGSQHNGISEFQNCGTTDWLCKAAEGLLRGSTWSSFVQSRLVPAQYFRDPNQYEQYLENSNFLADINNERLLKNRAYKRNMEKLERFVMYIFEDDTTVIPKESGWFAEVNGTEITPLKERDIYKEDWIGLKTLDKKGALHFKTTEGGHMALSDKLLGSVFKENYGPMKKSTKVFDIPSPQEVRPNLPLDALAEYEKQLERLVEQNKLRLELARQEQDVVDGVVSWPEAAGYIVEDKKLDAEAATLAQNADYEKQLELLEQAKQKELMEQVQNFAFRVQREHGPKKDEM